MDTADRLERIKLFASCITLEQKKDIFRIVKQYKQRYTITDTNIFINVSRCSDNCIASIYNYLFQVK